MLLFGKSLSTRRIVIISTVQFLLQDMLHVCFSKDMDLHFCQGWYHSFNQLSKGQKFQQLSDSEIKDNSSKEKFTPIVESIKEVLGWPYFGQPVVDQSKLAGEALAGMPSRFKTDSPRIGLTQLKDSLRMPEDEVVPTLVQRQSRAAEDSCTSF